MNAVRIVRDRPPFWLLVPAIAIALTMLGPIVYLALRASEADRDIWALIWRERTARIAWNTLKLGIGVGVGSALIAVPLAWITGRPSANKINSTIRPLTRDGGARVNVDDRLYDTVRGSHTGELYDGWGRFWR